MDENMYNLTMTFGKTENYNFGEVTVTPRLLRVLSLIDGKRNVAAIKEKLGLGYDEIYRELQVLHDLSLVQILELKSLGGEGEKVKDLNYRGTKLKLVKSSSADQGKVEKTGHKIKEKFYRGNSY